MRFIFFILLLMLFSFSFAEQSFGSSRILMEKTWVVSCTDPSCDIDFEGILVLNNSNQKVISIATEPEMELVTDEHGETHLLYSGKLPNGSITLTAAVEVEVDYNTNIMEDSVLTPQEVNVTELTEADEDISAKAAELADSGSVLMTLRNMVEWINRNIEYDILYFGQNKNAQEVFIERRGVCVEYSHLLISMLNSQGIKTRYVNGYVISDEWQPHAWTEAYVPGYGWIPIDPTFNQIGILDSSHVMVSYGYDQSSDYDRLTATSENVMLNRFPTEITLLSSEKNRKGLSVDIGFENKTYTAVINVGNSRGDYVFGLYSFYPPTGYGETVNEIILFLPYEIIKKRFRYDSSLFEEGYSYTLPMKATLNDAEDQKMVVLVRPSKPTAEEETCPLAIFIGLVALFSAMRGTSNHS